MKFWLANNKFTPLGVAVSLPMLQAYQEKLNSIAAWSGTIGTLCAGPIAIVTLWRLLRKRNDGET